MGCPHPPQLGEREGLSTSMQSAATGRPLLGTLLLENAGVFARMDGKRIVGIAMRQSPHQAGTLFPEVVMLVLVVPPGVETCEMPGAVGGAIERLRRNGRPGITTKDLQADLAG